jgi:hypothetical protein
MLAEKAFGERVYESPTTFLDANAGNIMVDETEKLAVTT